MQLRSLLAGLAAGTVLASGASAEVITTQITDVQSGLLGVTVPFDGVTAPDDTGLVRFNSGTGATLVDGNSADGPDNFGGGAAGDLGYIGIVFNSAQDNVVSFEFDIEVFGDGGFFVTANDNGNTLAPIVQVTTADLSGLPNSGSTFISNNDNIWTTIGATNDYPVVDGAGGLEGTPEEIAATNGAAAAAGIVTGDTFTFTFDAAQSGITGIRVLGSQGGTAAATQGFLGATEVRAFAAVPEPGSLALLGLGGLLIIRRQRG